MWAIWDASWHSTEPALHPAAVHWDHGFCTCSSAVPALHAQQLPITPQCGKLEKNVYNSCS